MTSPDNGPSRERGESGTAFDAVIRHHRQDAHATREAIERTSPKLVVCDHIHACGGQSAQVGSTQVVNAGPVGRILTVE